MADRHIFYQNINLDVANKAQKRVLISYICKNFTDFGRHITHPNVVEASVICKCFIDFGYVVDVAYCRDMEVIQVLAEKKYDVIFGFGDPFKAACKFNEGAKKIAYMTEGAPSFSGSNERKRVEYYLERHGRVIELQRTGLFYKDGDFAGVKSAIFLGNNFTKAGWQKDYPQMDIKILSPSALFNENFVLQRNVPAKDFLWFGSGGAVHKGLDILLDVFIDVPEIKLYVAGLSRRDAWLLDDYKQCPNIINLGFVDVQSDEFIGLMRAVSFVVLPSASEGMATSVLTCMRHGLIPVVTSATGIDVHDFGVYLEDYRVEYVGEVLHKLFFVDDVEINAMKQKVYQYANEYFTIEVFRDNFKRIVGEILYGNA